jgi:DNA polymerase-3 subunit alpha (Gram-positive type)
MSVACNVVHASDSVEAAMKEVPRFFNPDELYEYNKNDYESSVGTIGIPEFGTDFVKRMLKETKPKTFSDLIRISGLSHGTDVWSGNARNLILENSLSLKDLIACRDDIMVYLIKKGLPPITSFLIMEDVRKGKGLKSEYVELMQQNNISN